MNHLKLSKLFEFLSSSGSEFQMSGRHSRTPDSIRLTRPGRFVTFYISALEILLLTYLLFLSV